MVSQQGLIGRWRCFHWEKTGSSDPVSRQDAAEKPAKGLHESSLRCNNQDVTAKSHRAINSKVDALNQEMKSKDGDQKQHKVSQYNIIITSHGYLSPNMRGIAWPWSYTPCGEIASSTWARALLELYPSSWHCERPHSETGGSGDTKVVIVVRVEHLRTGR